MLLGSDLDWLRRRDMLSEAEDDKEDEDTADDYQLDDTDSTPPDDEGDPATEGGDEEDEHAPDTTPTDEGGTGEEAEDYQLGDDDTSPDGEGDTDTTDSGDGTTDAGATDTDETADTEVDGEVGAEGEEDKLKKLVLLNQYKELTNLVNNLSLSINNLETKVDFSNDDDLEYLQSKLEDLKSKMAFTVQTKFLTGEYQQLLKLFYYYKFHLNDLAKFAEKLIK
jgi:hypothetical protein